MSLLDWFTDITSGPSCDTVAAWVAVIRDPFNSVYWQGDAQTGGYVLVPGRAPDPARSYFIVSRSLFASSDDVQAATKLLRAIYKTPRSASCADTIGLVSATGRARMLDALSSYSGQFTAADVAAVTEVLAIVLADPPGPYDDTAASRAPGAREAAVVYAATKLVLSSPHSGFDQATWLPLWRWALGGPGGQAGVGVRIGAMKALQAILRRGSLTPRQVLMASSMADVLRQLVEQRAVSLPAAQRELFLAEANALWGAMRLALLQAAQAAPASAAVANTAVTLRRWWLPVAAAAAVTAVAIGVYRRRAA